MVHVDPAGEDQTVHDRHDQQRHHRADREATDDGARQGHHGFVAFAEPESQRQQSKNRRERGHHNGTNPAPAGFHHGFLSRGSGAHHPVGEVHQQDAVRDDDAHHHERADHRLDVDRGVREVQDQHRADPAQAARPPE